MQPVPSRVCPSPTALRAADARRAGRQHGFTLLELMMVVTLFAVIAGMATVALRDRSASQLEEEGARLSALLEGARARSRSMGLEVHWQPSREGNGFIFSGLPDTIQMPDRWLNDSTRAQVIGGGGALQLGPEPVIGAQQVVLSLEDQRLTLATNGLGPFVQVDASTVATP